MNIEQREFFSEGMRIGFTNALHQVSKLSAKHEKENNDIHFHALMEASALIIKAKKHQLAMQEAMIEKEGTKDLCSARERSDSAGTAG